MSFSRHLGRATATTVATGVVFLAGMVTSGHASAAYDPTVWDRVAACESSGRWSINTGNGYYGGLQFSASTWKGFGGQAYATYAHQASKAEQIAIARRVLHTQGPGAWPTCSRKAGLTRDNGGASPTALPDGSSGTPALSTVPGPTPPTTPTAPAPSAPASGDLAVDGVLGPATTRAMQTWVGTTADGRWGSQTTRALQRTVGATVDGVKGPETTRRTQQKVGATVDGRWGSGTTRALQRYLNDLD